MAEIITPEVGMGATIQVGSDCYPYTVIAVSPSGKTVTIQEDEAQLVSGSIFSKRQEYEYRSNPNGRTMTVRRNKHGRWGKRHFPVYIGRRRYYRDPSF